VTTLLQWISLHPTAQIHLNFPGIGNGGLPRTQVFPLLQPLPGNVTIWEYPTHSSP